MDLINPGCFIGPLIGLFALASLHAAWKVGFWMGRASVLAEIEQGKPKE